MARGLPTGRGSLRPPFSLNLHSPLPCFLLSFQGRALNYCREERRREGGREGGRVFWKPFPVCFISLKISPATKEVNISIGEECEAQRGKRNCPKVQTYEIRSQLSYPPTHLSTHSFNRLFITCSLARALELPALSHFTAKQEKPGSGGASEGGQQEPGLLLYLSS